MNDENTIISATLQVNDVCYKYFYNDSGQKTECRIDLFHHIRRIYPLNNFTIV